ncbi:MAG: hypothetical protein NTX71_03910 [Candidatus Aureabacteria bacterium]|nr:hypothetical protein [Candidatus Auribacterota bacterium]
MIYGKDNRELMDAVRRHPDFRDFVVPISTLNEIRDANFFLRRDGLLAFSEGYCHPPGKLIGNIIYIPSPMGTKRFFGVPYASIIKHYGGEEEKWVTFKEQLKIYREIDPSTQTGKPIFAENKCVFNLDDFLGYIPPLRSLEIVRSRMPQIDATIREIGALLGIDHGKIGCTGSMSFGNIGEAHDFDLVFYGEVGLLREVLSAIYEIVKDPARQVFELGMLWAIRFYDTAGNMICPFFSYDDPSEIPLPKFEMELHAGDIEATMTIGNDDHTGFMPSFLPLSGASAGGESLGENSVLIIYHGGKRGEYRKGDHVRARGHRVRVSTARREFDAILVTDMGNTEKLVKC